MGKLLGERSYSISVVVCLVVILGVFLYLGKIYTPSGQATVKPEQCTLTWEFTGESTSQYKDLMQATPSYLAMIDDNNQDVDCIDPATGKARRDFDTAFVKANYGYVVDADTVRVVDYGNSDYVDVSIQTCLKKDSKRYKDLIIGEAYYDVPYKTKDNYIDFNADGVVRLLQWDRIHTKDVKFSIERKGNNVVRVDADDTGLRYLVVWSDGNVIEYKVDENFTFYEKRDWYGMAQDAEFLNNGGVVVVKKEGIIIYLDANGDEMKTVSMSNQLGEEYEVYEFDPLLTDDGFDTSQFLVSLLPKTKLTGKVVRISC